MDLYVYADETCFERPQAANFTVGYGLLFSVRPIGHSVVEEALAKLNADPDSTKPPWSDHDQRTLSRGWFHAADDSKNSHSHFCTAIREHVSAAFSYVLVEGSSAGAISNPEEFYQAAFRLSANEIFSRSSNVRLFVEQRTGLSQNTVLRLLKDLHLDLEKAVLNMPILPLYCPKFTVAIQHKQEPGLQVVDFLLWACARAKSKAKDSLWLDRLNAVGRADMSEQGQPDSEGILYLDWSSVESAHGPYPTAIEQISDAGPDDPTRDWQFITRTIRGVTSLDPLPDSINHLTGDVAAATSSLADADPKRVRQGLQRIASTFLRLFDTMPIYANVSQTDVQQWAELLSARRMAASVLENARSRSLRLRFEAEKLQRENL